MSANDICALENLNPIPDEEGGNTYLINGNMLPISMCGLSQLVLLRLPCKRRTMARMLIVMMAGKLILMPNSLGTHHKKNPISLHSGDARQRRNRPVNNFWNWVKNEDTGQRELYLEGVIAQESWFGDEVTPAAFKADLASGSGPITIHINSVGGDCIAASMIYTMLMDYPADVNVQIDGLAASAASVIAMAGTHVSMSPTALLITSLCPAHFGINAKSSVISEVKRNSK